MTPQETFERFFPAMFAQDVATLSELFADDVEWHAPPFAAEKYGALVGRDAVIGFLTGAGDEYYKPGSYSLEIELQAVEGDQAIMLGRIRATTAKGEPYDNRYAFGFRFADGRIREAWELLDSLHFEQQMGSPPSPLSPLSP